MPAIVATELQQRVTMPVISHCRAYRIAENRFLRTTSKGLINTSAAEEQNTCMERRIFDYSQVICMIGYDKVS